MQFIQLYLVDCKFVKLNKSTEGQYYEKNS